MFDPLELARVSVETYLSQGMITSVPPDTPPEFIRPSAAFVSLKLDGRLRGCIGTFMPTQTTLAEEIIQNAIQSATRDARFTPLTLDELEEVVFSVDVLSPPEPIRSPDELDPKIYGVIVKAGPRRGLLLPDLEGVETADEQVAVARRKAGIAAVKPIELSRFRVVRYK